MEVQTSNIEDQNTKSTGQKSKKIYPWRAIASFLLVLFTMPLGHAIMILMEKFMDPTAVHYAGFTMGFVGLVMVIIGVFVKGDTRQTLWGLIGGLLFWTGWVEFLFLYYARRYGVPPEIENGQVVTKPEYLIMPASFGMWMMVMTMYIFSTKNGCDFITWIQKKCFGKRKQQIAFQPMTRHTSIVTRWCQLPCRVIIHVQTPAFPGILGCKHPYGDCYSDYLLDSSGDPWAYKLLP